MNERYNTLYTADQVDVQISRIAGEIIRDQKADNPLFVALLRGAAPFASKLMFEIAKQAPDMHPDLDYMMVSTYGSTQRAHEPRIVTDLAPDTDVRGRTVIVLDDVLDKGITAEFVRRHLASMGASAVKLAVLAQKQVERVYDITPDYCGFDATDEWLVGMGMDDAGLSHEGNRWIGEILEIRRN
ncbi:MAG: phosphoribosyltransferase family protein [Candidatus Saccharimonas sp.]